MKRIIALLSVIALGLFFSVQAKTYTSAFSQDFDDADTYTANFSDGTVASDILGTVDSDSCDCAFRIIGDEKIRGYFDSFTRTDDELYTNSIPNSAASKWALSGIPRFECPDAEIERTYYFRWWTYRKHLKRTKSGWVVTEFLPSVPWAAKENTISCALNHHVAEGRWLRSREYIDGYLRFMMTEGCVNGPRSYACAPAYAALEYAKATGDYGLAESLLPLFAKNCDAWEAGWTGKRNFFVGYRPERGLYDIYGDREGTEYNISADGARPMVNSMRWADMDATAKIAALAGEKDTAEMFRAKAAALENEIKTRLWNGERRFFTTLSRNGGGLDGVCELHGYAPFYFGMDLDESYRAAFRRLADEKGFYAPHGLAFPTLDTPGFRLTPDLEGHECQWDGPSWPYATSIALTALAKTLQTDGDGVPGVTKADFARLLRQYAAQHRLTREDGTTIPWVDEDCDPFTGEWIARKILLHRASAKAAKPSLPERGKDYNHSTFCDLVISGLCGVNADLDGNLAVKPLAPEEWDWWCLEGVRWHGRDLTVLFDRDGSRYGKGTGLKIIFNPQKENKP